MYDYSDYFYKGKIGKDYKKCKYHLFLDNQSHSRSLCKKYNTQDVRDNDNLVIAYVPRFMDFLMSQGNVCKKCKSKIDLSVEFIYK